MNINNIIREEVRKVMVNTFWYQAPAQAPTYYGVIDIVSDGSIADKDLSIPNAISTLRISISLFGTDPVCLRQYAKLLREHMRKVKGITSDDSNVTLHNCDYIVGLEGYIADVGRFYQTLEYYVKFTAKEITLTPEELDAMCGNDEVYGEDITPTFRKINLHSHLTSNVAFNEDEPLSGWTPPDSPRLSDTVTVLFTNGIAYYTYDGDAWVYNYFYAGGGSPPSPGGGNLRLIVSRRIDGLITVHNDNDPYQMPYVSAANVGNTIQITFPQSVSSYFIYIENVAIDINYGIPTHAHLYSLANAGTTMTISNAGFNPSVIGTVVINFLEFEISDIT